MGHASHEATPGHTSQALLENLRALSYLATAASLHGGEEDPFFDAPVREAEDLRAPCRLREMDVVCEQCGDVGVQDLLLGCSKCKSAARHRYCLDEITFDSELEWLCSDCIPKHNEAIKSLEGAANQRQLGSSTIMKPNVEKEKVTIARGPHRNRANQKRKYHVDESTIHSQSGDTSNRGRNRPHKERGDTITTQSCSGDASYSCAIFGGDIPNRNDCEKDGDDRNGHLICTVESLDGSSNLASDHALEVESNNLQKAMCGFELSSNSVECPDLSNVRSGCFASSNYVQGLVPLGRKGDIVSLINDVKGSHPMIEGKSHPTVAIVEQVDISSVIREKSELKAVKAQDKSVAASISAANCAKLMQGSDEIGNADVLKPLQQRLDSWSRVPMQSSPSNDLEDTAVQENSAEGTRCLEDEDTLAPILKNRTSDPSMANDRLVYNEGNSGEANRRSDEVLLSTVGKKMQRRKSVDREVVNSCKVNGILDPDSAQGDPDTSIAGMTSYLGQKEMILKQVLQEDEDTLAPILKNSTSDPSMANERLVCNEGNLAEANRRSDEVSLSTIGKKMQRQTSVDREIVNSCKVNGIFDPDSAQGDPDTSIAGMTSYLGQKEMILKQVLQEDEDTLAPILKNSTSDPSMANERLVCNEGNLAEANRRSDEVSLSTIGKKMQRQNSVDREIVNSCKVNGILDPDSAQGDPDASITAMTSHGKKKRILKQVLQEEGINSELLPSKFVGPCESTKTNPRKRKQSDSYIPDGIKYRKASIINENKKVNPARSKSRRPAPVASLRVFQNMPTKDNGSSKVIGNSKKETDKKMDKSWLAARKASRGSRKTASDLQPSPLQRSSVDKSIPYSENMDENGSLRNLNAGCAENDVSQLALQTGVTDDRSDILKTSLIPESIGMQPLDKPYWSGIMKIDENYIPLSAHLSTKAGKKVQELSRSLPPMMEVTKLSTLKSCPKHLEAPIPSADSIDLYFFCGDTRPNKELDQLVKHVADRGIILEAIVGLAKLCLFPSLVLPEECQTFQGKPYLWGLFNPRKNEIKRLAPVKQDCTTQVTEEEHAQEQHVLDQQDKAYADTQDQVVHSKKQPLLGASREVRSEVLSDNVLPLVDMEAVVSTNTSPAAHGQPYSNLEARPLKLCGFVMSRTPRSAELIQEMQKEGALLFAVQQVATEPGSVV